MKQFLNYENIQHPKQEQNVSKLNKYSSPSIDINHKINLIKNDPKVLSFIVNKRVKERETIFQLKCIK